MRHDWVLDVLDDLIFYARRNDLPGLAEGAQGLRVRAVAELAEIGLPPNSHSSGAHSSGGHSAAGHSPTGHSSSGLSPSGLSGPALPQADLRPLTPGPKADTAPPRRDPAH